MNKTRFVVDSAQILIIDPIFLETFARHFSYQDFIRFKKEGGKPQDYINEVVAKAFPGVSASHLDCLVGLLEADGIYGDTEFVGDGVYEVSSEAIKMTPEYKQVFLSWVAKEVA
ncbi:MAG TPA: hypothetical protein DCP08_00505 [Chloroflexi bacterium]|nr:hypothetical protein [Chloroflexota bacterium]